MGCKVSDKNTNKNGSKNRNLIWVLVVYASFYGSMYLADLLVSDELEVKINTFFVNAFFSLFGASAIIILVYLGFHKIKEKFN
jgi:hypothetical protein